MPVEVHPLTLRQTWESVRTNRPLLVLCASTLVLLAGQFTIVGAQAHYAMLALGASADQAWSEARGPMYFSGFTGRPDS